MALFLLPQQPTKASMVSFTQLAGCCCFPINNLLGPAAPTTWQPRRPQLPVNLALERICSTSHLVMAISSWSSTSAPRQ